MSHPTQASTRNSLLTALSSEDYALLEPHLTRVRLAKGDTLVVPDEPIEFIYFPETALGSVIAASPEGHKIEGSMVGCEGMTGVAIILATDRTPHQIVIQIEGEALRMSAEAFRTAMSQSPSLIGTMLRFVKALYVQTTYTALSNGHHGVEERLARWLLMCHDRSPGDTLALTHEFLSIMLAVRRPSVTTALHMLEGAGFIRAHRGKITIRDRQALEDYAHDAYGIPEGEYTRLVGPMPRAAEFASFAALRNANQKTVDAYYERVGA
jgi:CRP-like cAMP-binding protein